MSAFAALLIEARDTLMRLQRRQVGVHFDWTGGDDAQSWRCWYDDGPIAFGSAGEEALRRMVEALRNA